MSSSSSSSSSKGRGKSLRRPKLVRQDAMRAPQLSSNIVVRHRFRFLSTSANATPITGVTLGGAAGTRTAVVNTSVGVLSDYVRLQRITILAPPASQGSAASCSINWAGTNSPDIESSDTTNSVASPARVSNAPPARSLASFWHATTDSSTLCTLVAPVGSIIDVDVAFVLSDSGTVTQTLAVSTAASDTTYYLALDGPTTNLYTPVSLTTTH